ncbi:PDZ domain-containing protein [Paenibacillus caseinilyticus]|uniref:Serine protease n=1 Tax=Paenibacillus mucilaginosus K02 TaxID=997761 RepID=I0BA56_9BACL|nr:PDZ domain-containing protein [Paenibacillus mucilaginosus]AFH59253.1 serine protease [Paenibacillus mucilaginosus K02]
MGGLIDWGFRGLKALTELLLNPFYYVGILFIVLQYRRQILLERKLFSVKLHSLISETWRTVLWGWIGGLAASAVMAGIGAVVQPEAVVLLWIVSLLLIWARVRFLCWAYAIGVLGILQAVLVNFPALQEALSWRWAVDSVLALHMPSLFALVAVLHLIEALLVRRQGTRFGTPVFVESKRGKIVGGYQLQGFWPVALFLTVPMQGGAPLPWTPLLGGDLYAGGWAVLALPVMIGFTDMTTSRLPREKVQLSSGLLVLYAALLLLLTALSAWWASSLLAVSLLCILLHEAIVFYSRWDESRRSPVFVHGNRGLKILGILPGSPAAELGLQVGESLYKVNGMIVRTRQELHHALSQNAAFCRLEILNLVGESKFVKRAIFSGEHHLLGIILAPDEDVLYYTKERPLPFWAYLGRRVRGLSDNRPRPKSM